MFLREHVNWYYRHHFFNFTINIMFSGDLHDLHVIVMCTILFISNAFVI